MSHQDAPQIPRSNTFASASSSRPDIVKRSVSGSEGIHFKLPSLHHSQDTAASSSEKHSVQLHATGSLPTSSLTHLTDSNWAQRAEDFEIQQPIGYGSSAVVYAAIYKPMNKRVAIKMIDLDMFERNQIDELRRETALMALSKHPNVLRVYGSFVCESKLYIVTPYLSGGSCLDIMKTAFQDGFDEISIATILKQALEALVYLHKNGHIHRDVKAGNLLMDEHGTVLLADFGVSSSLTENSELRKTFVGTPCWMAPEVMEQAGYDYKADIWSFGITAIELATGHAPFAKYPPMKVLMMTLSNDPPTLDREHTKHKYSKTFKEMIDMCLQKDPKKRPSAEKLLHHPFFKEAKKKEYLVKSVLAHVPPLDRRPHKKVPQKQVSVETTEQWDFDTQPDVSVSTQPQPPPDPKHEALQQHPTTTEPTINANHKKHISFGDVVIRNPPQPHIESSSPSSIITSPELAAPAPAKRSRFVVEENRETEHHNTVSSQRSISPQTEDSHPSQSPFLSPITNADANEAPTGLGISSASPIEVKKGRFSVNQTPHRTPTPMAGEESDHSVSGPEVRPVPVDRVASHESLPEGRKSRFEVLPLSGQPTDVPPKTESVPLSRENSISQMTKDGPLLPAKTSRFSVEKEQRDVSREAQPQHRDYCEVAASSPECRKKGRFELTGGSTTATEMRHEKVDVHQLESPQSPLSGGSPTTSPCSSVSRGQSSRLLDPSMPHMMQSHIEAMLKQVDAQRTLLQDMLFGISMMQGASAPDSKARSRASSSSESRKSFAESSSALDHSSRSRSASLSAEIFAAVEHLQQLLLTSNREREKLIRENESLKKEISRLRRSQNNEPSNQESG